MAKTIPVAFVEVTVANAVLSVSVAVSVAVAVTLTIVERTGRKNKEDGRKNIEDFESYMSW